MSMAATQARQIMLQARKSNLEYQAQQINQERSVLSQQCTAMYNSLLALSVPTPPSLTEYTKISYTGVNGASNITLGSIKPSGTNFNVEIKTTATGKSLSQDYGEVACRYSYEINKNDLDKYRIVNDKNEVVTGVDLREYCVENGDMYIVNLPAGMKLVSNDTNETANESVYIEGKKAYSFEVAQREFPEYDWGGYETAISNAYGDDYAPSDFYVYFSPIGEDGEHEVKFVLKDDVKLNDSTPNSYVNTYSFIANGQFINSDFVDGCRLTFDSQGMISNIEIPSKTGEMISVALTATKITDDLAYNDAMNKYEYAQYEYDQRQHEINAKTEIIQQQDRNLELKLQRLDTERQQIEAEYESLQKVIKDNIDKTFKTFNA